jgi:hypothetical protein
MTISDDLTGLLDAIIPDPAARDTAKRNLLALQGSPPLAANEALLTEVQSTDPWTARARPGFLYVMYVLLLWSIPMGLIAAIRPVVADGIAHGMTAYLNGIPEPLYALFGTGFLGYTVARSWGKAKGVER